LGFERKKYEWLLSNSVNTTRWSEISPQSELYYFVPRNIENDKIYSKFVRITDTFNLNSVGVVTARDKLTIQKSKDEMWAIIQSFIHLPEEQARLQYRLGKDARDWKVSFAQQDLLNTGLDRKHLVPILYRPFDIRFTYYTGHSRGFICMPRPEVMSHMLKSNVALLVHKREELDVPYTHFLVTDCISEHGCLSSKTTNYHFPLYLYTGKQKKG
jgi:predicted helicase